MVRHGHARDSSHRLSTLDESYNDEGQHESKGQQADERWVLRGRARAKNNISNRDKNEYRRSHQESERPLLQFRQERVAHSSMT
jgi:hypothetical protein